MLFNRFGRQASLLVSVSQERITINATKALLSSDIGRERNVVLQHEEYEQLHQKLMRADTLNALEKAAKHIIMRDNLRVNPEIMHLNALSLGCHKDSRPAYANVVNLRKLGKIKTGNYSSYDRSIMAKNFELLLEEVGVDRSELLREICPSHGGGREHLLMRHLFGLFLIQGLPDQEKRLPVEAFSR